MHKPKYLLVVNHVVTSIFKAVDELKAMPELADLQVLVITNQTSINKRYARHLPPQNIIYSNYEPQELRKALESYGDSIVGVVCRGDKHIQYLRKLLPYLPDNVAVASEEALDATTNKRKMRQGFTDHYPEITPSFLEVSDASAKTLDTIEASLGYPAIVKPANLFSSLLIQSCQDREQLRSALQKTFAFISDTYKREGIKYKPQVIVEQFLEGDFYSIDAYVMNDGEVFCCPPVAYIPAKKLGIDDFFLYKRFIPTSLSGEEIEAANTATKKALAALNLENSTAHVELILTDAGWKLIEVGPRIGRFRNLMYDLSYGINHSLNDVKIHLGIKPESPNKLIQYCAAYSIYPHMEGELIEISGIKKLVDSELIKSLRIIAQPGEMCRFAKNGGHALAEFTIASADKKSFDKMCEYVENHVKAIIKHN